MTYIGVYIDGMMNCTNPKLGLLKTMPDTTLILAYVVAGSQRHPVWALDRLAVEIHAYTQSAIKHGCDALQVNVHGTLASDSVSSRVILNSVTWHTSKSIHEEARRMIGEISKAPWPRDTEVGRPLEPSLTGSIYALWSRYVGA
jgi:hypothetical protein